MVVWEGRAAIRLPSFLAGTFYEYGLRYDPFLITTKLFLTWCFFGSYCFFPFYWNTGCSLYGFFRGGSYSTRLLTFVLTSSSSPMNVLDGDLSFSFPIFSVTVIAPTLPTTDPSSLLLGDFESKLLGTLAIFRII